MITLHTAPAFDETATIDWLSSPHRDGVSQAEAHAFAPDLDTHSEAACGIVTRLVDNAIAAGVFGPAEQAHQRIYAQTTLDEDNYADGIIVTYALAQTPAGDLTLASDHMDWTALFGGTVSMDAAYTALETVYRTAVTLRETFTAALSAA